MTPSSSAGSNSGSSTNNHHNHNHNHKETVPPPPSPRTRQCSRLSQLPITRMAYSHHHHHHDATSITSADTAERELPPLTSSSVASKNEYDSEDGDVDITDAAVPSKNVDMHQSLFSLMKSAGRPAAKFQPRFDNVSSDDDDDDDEDSNDNDISHDNNDSNNVNDLNDNTNNPDALLAAAQLPSSRSVRQSVSFNPDATTRILPPSLTRLTSSTSEPRAPFLSMVLQGEADMEASQKDDVDFDATAAAAATSVDNVVITSTPTSLAQRLKDIFGMMDLEEVTAEFPCWLLHSVLVNGHLYITSAHACFYAYCPKVNSVTKSGHLRKRGRHNPHYRPYHTELKGNNLLYYNRPTNKYEPSGVIDLTSAISAIIDPQEPNSSYFKITTESQVYFFKAENHTSAKDWVKHLQRVIFRSHNDGDSVKICIPLTNIVDVENQEMLEVSDTVKLRVIDNYDTYNLDEYFFSFFDKGGDAIDLLQQVLEKNIRDQRDHLETPDEGNSNTTSTTTKEARRSIEAVRNTLSPFEYEDPIAKQEKSPRLIDANSYLRSDLINSNPSPIFPHKQHPKIKVTDISASQILNNANLFQAATGSGRPLDDSDDGSGLLGTQTTMKEPPSPTTQKPLSSSTKSLTLTLTESRQFISKHNFSNFKPPSVSISGLIKSGASGISKISSAATTTAKFLTTHSRRLTTDSFKNFDEHWKAKPHRNELPSGAHPDGENDTEAKRALRNKRFQDHFALSDSEPLVSDCCCWLMRLVGNYGKIYVGKRHVCYRSFYTRTKLIYPLDELESITKVPHSFFNNATSTFELIITPQGHEPLFLVFSNSDARDEIYGTILRAKYAYGNDKEKEKGKGEAVASEAMAEYEALKQAAGQVSDPNRDSESESRALMTQQSSLSDQDESGPGMFDDLNHSFLSFKPQKPMNITLLTIGSRGDVQPYIALGKGLIAEGHNVKIATHIEFEPWIRQHGIPFAPVSGDPGELMRICIEYGMFTISFLWEAIDKFSDWIEDLLVTAWKACQGSDLLIESPSAMAGIHIAEALKIPYFRAFTMPWTQTKVYPHAFSVPAVKRGGNWNYYSYSLIDQVFWQGTARTINKWRRRDLNLRGTSRNALQTDKVPFLYNYSPSVVPRAHDYEDWIRITGYWFLEEGSKTAPSREIVAFIEKAKKDGKKLVYIGFGSILVENPVFLTQTIVDAVVRADVRCILAKGWSDRKTKAEKVKHSEDVAFPDSIFRVKSVPHDWLFPQMNAIVHHGGSGTTGASLRAGIPTIIKPFFGDQFFFATRVVDLGVGIALEKINALFWRALRDATTDERMIKEARLLGEKIRAEDGVGNAINAIYRDLDYATSLIKTQQQQNEDQEQQRTEGSTKSESGNDEQWTLVEPDLASSEE